MRTIPDPNPYRNFYTHNVNGLPFQKRSSFADKREAMLSNTLDQIAPKYEEMGNLLSHIPEPKKSQILGGIISRAIYADDPIVFINKQLKNWRKAKFYNRMLDNVSLFLGYDKQLTKEYLKRGLKEDVME